VLFLAIELGHSIQRNRRATPRSKASKGRLAASEEFVVCGRRNVGRLGKQYVACDSGGEEPGAMVGGAEILRQRHVTYLTVWTAQNQYLPLKSCLIETRIG